MKIESNAPKLTPVQVYLVARALESNIKDFFKDTQNQEKFAEWKAKKNNK